jgi:hypothetical protein
MSVREKLNVRKDGEWRIEPGRPEMTIQAMNISQ